MCLHYVFILTSKTKTYLHFEPNLSINIRLNKYLQNAIYVLLCLIHILLLSHLLQYICHKRHTKNADIQFELIAECQIDAKFHLSFIVNRIFTFYNMYTVNRVVVGFFPL